MDDKVKKDFDYQRLTPALIEQREQELKNPAPLVSLPVPKRDDPDIIDKLPYYLLTYGNKVTKKLAGVVGIKFKVVGVMLTGVAWLIDKTAKHLRIEQK